MLDVVTDDVMGLRWYECGGFLKWTLNPFLQYWLQSVLHKIDLLFQSALTSAERSVLLRLFLSQYVRWYRKNSSVEMLHLKALGQVCARPWVWV